MRRIENRRGSVFLKCGLSARDSRYARYPPVPVLECGGFARSEDIRDCKNSKDRD
jgi:hypothetical protein